MFTTDPYNYSKNYPITWAYTFSKSPTSSSQIQAEDIIAIKFKIPARNSWDFSAESTQWIPLDLFDAKYWSEYYIHSDDWQVVKNTHGLPMIDNAKISTLQLRVVSKTEKVVSLILV